MIKTSVCTRDGTRCLSHTHIKRAAKVPLPLTEIANRMAVSDTNPGTRRPSV